MTSQYTSDYPSLAIDPSIPGFFETFYQLSDTPDAHERYVGAFTDDAVMVMASKRARGKEEILALRHGMWSAVTARSHNPTKVFPFGSNSEEVMLYGTVEYTFKDESKGKASKDWAARAKLRKVGEEWRLAEYQVYLDTAS